MHCSFQPFLDWNVLQFSNNFNKWKEQKPLLCWNPTWNREIQKDQGRQTGVLFVVALGSCSDLPQTHPSDCYFWEYFQSFPSFSSHTLFIETNKNNHTTINNTPLSLVEENSVKENRVTSLNCGVGCQDSMETNHICWEKKYLVSTFYFYSLFLNQLELVSACPALHNFSIHSSVLSITWHNLSPAFVLCFSDPMSASFWLIFEACSWMVPFRTSVVFLHSSLCSWMVFLRTLVVFLHSSICSWMVLFRISISWKYSLNLTTLQLSPAQTGRRMARRRKPVLHCNMVQITFTWNWALANVMESHLIHTSCHLSEFFSTSKLLFSVIN